MFLETPDLVYLQDPPSTNSSVPRFDRVYIHGSVTWDIPPLATGSAACGRGTEAKPSFQLSDLHIDFPTGQLSLVAGRFGSGKTLLLLSLLGETRLLEGKMSYLASEVVNPKDATIPDWSLQKGGVAYAPQVSVALGHRAQSDDPDCMATELEHQVGLPTSPRGLLM